jgi:hypothetical protein
LLTAAHLSRLGNASGLRAEGVATWDSGGRLAETFAQPGLACRVVTIPLRTGTSFLDDGYSATTHPELTLKLIREGVHTQALMLPAG